MTAREILKAMLTSIWYNRDTEDYMRLLEELATRIAGNYCEWSDDGNIVYGTLVMLYGDYGVSTRAGWIDGDDLKEDLIDLLGDLRGEELEIRKSREEDN